jgi:hypothetical protein
MAVVPVQRAQHSGYTLQVASANMQEVHLVPGPGPVRPVAFADDEEVVGSVAAQAWVHGGVQAWVGLHVVERIGVDVAVGEEVHTVAA